MSAAGHPTAGGWEALREWICARAVPAKHARVTEDDPIERARLLGRYQALHEVNVEMIRLEREERERGE